MAATMPARWLTAPNRRRRSAAIDVARAHLVDLALAAAADRDVARSHDADVGAVHRLDRRVAGADHRDVGGAHLEIAELDIARAGDREGRVLSLAARGDAARAGERHIGLIGLQAGDGHVARSADRRGEAAALDLVDLHVARAADRRRAERGHGHVDDHRTALAVAPVPAVPLASDLELVTVDPDLHPPDPLGIALGPYRRRTADGDDDVRRSAQRHLGEGADREVLADLAMIAVMG